MDYLDEDEIKQEIVAIKTYLRKLREGYRHYTLAHATKNIDVDFHVVDRIDWYTEQIKVNEEELRKLITSSVKNKYTLDEIKYRIHLAEIFQYGIPTYADSLKNELLRLELGINIDRAKDIENNVKLKLSCEILNRFNDRDFLSLIDRVNSSARISPTASVIVDFNTSIILDYNNSALWFNKRSQRVDKTLVRTFLAHLGTYFPESQKNTLQLFVDEVKKGN